MKWLENNPIGVGLAAVCGLLLVVAAVMTWVWNWAPASEADPDTVAAPIPPVVAAVNIDLGPIDEYEEVNKRPVFNESRRPVVMIEGEEEVVEVVEDVADSPEVRLTGVVITPETRLVTLTPEQDGEPMIAGEGMQLEGEYIGWSVSKIAPRQVTLQSRSGESMEIELAVYDAMIEKPPEPEPEPDIPDNQETEPGTDPGRPMSRAEEIRQRIQERREQLRREAELDQEQEEAKKAEQTMSYQDAIRSLMKPKRNDENESKDDKG